MGHALQPPQKSKHLKVIGHGRLVQNGVQRCPDLVVERKHFPTIIPWRALQNLHVQLLQDDRIKILRVRGPHCAVDMGQKVVPEEAAGPL